MAKIKTVQTKQEDESTSTELVVYTPEEQAYLDSIKSQSQGQGQAGPQVSRLIINTKAKDEDGVKRPIGGWHITGTDKYFDGEIKFRPIRHMNKLIDYQEDESKKWFMAAESVYFKDFSEQIFDTKGGLALGRKFGKSHSDEEKAATKENADVYLDIFGLVQFGDEEWVPVLYRVRGSKLMKMINVFRAIPKDKIFSEYAYDIETFQPEGKTYWDINVKPDLKTKLRITDIIQHDKEIASFIAESNRATMAKHMSARGDTVAQNFSKAADKATVITDVELDDELPF